MPFYSRVGGHAANIEALNSVLDGLSGSLARYLLSSRYLSEEGKSWKRSPAVTWFQITLPPKK